MLSLGNLKTMLNQKTLEFHAIIERVAQDLDYGAASFTLQIKNGVPVIETLQITKTKRYKNSDKNSDILAKTKFNQ